MIVSETQSLLNRQPEFEMHNGEANYLAEPRITYTVRPASGQIIRELGLGKYVRDGRVFYFWRTDSIYTIDADRQSHGQGHREWGTCLSTVVERMVEFLETLP